MLAVTFNLCLAALKCNISVSSCHTYWVSRQDFFIDPNIVDLVGKELPHDHISPAWFFNVLSENFSNHLNILKMRFYLSSDVCFNSEFRVVIQLRWSYPVVLLFSSAVASDSWEFNWLWCRNVFPFKKINFFSPVLW